MIYQIFGLVYIIAGLILFSIVLELILNIIPPTILSLLMIRGKEYKL